MAREPQQAAPSRSSVCNFLVLAQGLETDEPPDWFFDVMADEISDGISTFEVAEHLYDVHGWENARVRSLAQLRRQCEQLRHENAKRSEIQSLE